MVPTAGAQRATAAVGSRLLPRHSGPTIHRHEWGVLVAPELTSLGGSVTAVGSE